MSEQEISNGDNVIFTLQNQKLTLDEGQKPSGFYIKGLIKDGKFIPKSEILGLGDLAQEGRYGWLEINSKHFFPMESDRKALSPFVKGYLTDKGFFPSQRQIINIP